MQLNGSVALVATGSNVLLVSVAQPFQPILVGQIIGTLGNWITLIPGNFLIGDGLFSTSSSISLTVTPVVPVAYVSAYSPNPIPLTIPNPAPANPNSRVLLKDVSLTHVVVPPDPSVVSDRVDIIDDLGSTLVSFQGTLAAGQGTVTWRQGSTVDVTRKYSAQVYATKDGLPIMTFPVALAFTSCGDIRDKIIQEYANYSVVDYATGKAYIPSCTEFTQDKHSTNFTFQQLNSGDYTWAILRDVLFQGLEAMQQDCWDEIGPAPAPVCNFTFTINSGYRNPAHNANIAGSSPNSRHQFGDGVDVNTASLTLWHVLHDIAKARGACVEPLALSTTSHVHAEWPDMKSITDPFTCKTGW